MSEYMAKKDNLEIGGPQLASSNVYAASAQSIGIGSKVKITGANYTTGQKIPDWVKANTYTVQQINGGKVLIQEIMSWVYANDVNLISGGTAQAASAPAKTETKTEVPKEPAPAASAPTAAPAATSIGAGSTVKITGSTYATGQVIPEWVKGRNHTVSRVDGDRALLTEIVSWVKVGDLVIAGGGAAKSTDEQKPVSVQQPAQQPVQQPAQQPVQQPKQTTITPFELTDAKMKSARSFYAGCSSEIPGIRSIIGLSHGTTMSDADIRHAAGWQKSAGLVVDGQIGATGRRYAEYAGHDASGVTVNDNKNSLLTSTMSKIQSKSGTITRIAQMTNLPPELVAAIWYREADLRDGVYLHNGQTLGQVTTIVPKGKYFEDFDEAAKDALSDTYYRSMCPGITSSTSDLALMCIFAETYNGLGYRKQGLSSAYVMASTTKAPNGRYSSDGNFVAETDQRLGTYVIMRELLNQKTLR